MEVGLLAENPIKAKIWYHGLLHSCLTLSFSQNLCMSPKQIILIFWLFLPLISQAAVEAFEIGPGNTDQLPKGKEADGIIGDLVMRNSHITAVISGNQPLRRANMSTFYGDGGITPGCLYDLTLNDRQNDQLTVFAPSNQRGDVSHVRIVRSDEETAEIEVVVDAARNNGLYKKITYSIDENSKGIVITTTFKNFSKVTKSGSVDDYWKPSGKRGTYRGVRWIDAVDPADKGSYAVGWLPENGERLKGLGSHPGSLSLKPGEHKTFTRYISAGNSPAEALGEVFSYTDKTSSKISIEIENSSTALINLTSKGISFPAYPAKNGESTFSLPEGDYDIEINDRGRKSVKQKISVNQKGTYELRFTLSDLSGVAFDIRDKNNLSTPCKIQFSGTGKTATPNLGPQNRAHGCVDQWHSETGKFNVALNPGTYRLVITRGVEFNHLVREVTVKAGQFTNVSGTLRRLVNTTGWISADFHNHSTPSGDNQCGTDDRIINLVAEHIEFAPTTEHNRLYNWAPHIKKLGLGNQLSTIVGLELTGGGAGSHHNAFPLPSPNPYAQDGGAPVFKKDPRLNVINLQNMGGWSPDRWIHVNHPNIAEKFWDRNLDGKADGGFAGYENYIDALESQNFRGNDILAKSPWTITRRGTSESVREVREFVWLQMLNQGMRTRAIAVADAHSVYGNGVGGWRTYIPSSTDEPGKIDPMEIIRNAKAAQLMLTTGPFLEVNVGKAISGSDIKSASGKVNLKVKVQCTDWIDIDRVQVLVNGKQKPEYNFTAKSHPKFFGTGVVKFDHTIEIKLEEDAHLIVVAMSENSTLKTGYGTSANASLKPCAYINPIWVDVDGGGFKANGDTLGWDLPVGRQDPNKIRALLKAKGLN